MLLAPSSDTELASVICVDLDGTLVRGDLLFEAILAAILRNPLVVFVLPIWLLHGRAYLKAKVAERSEFDASLLPYNEELIDYLKVQRRAGKEIYLTTAAYATHANRVADYLGLFDAVLATDHVDNLKGQRKLRAIEEILGGRSFLYAADSRDDLVIWRRSAGAIVVDAPRSVKGCLDDEGIPVCATFFRRRDYWKSAIRALRPHQWFKNVLVFCPLLLSHQLGNVDKVLASLLAFLSLSACASAFYVLNDLFDLRADRAHPRKRRRPFASGELSVVHGIGLLGGAILLSAVLAWPLPGSAKFLLGLYALVTVAYSTRLKQVLFLDVIILAFLYTLRLLLGGASADIVISFWTLAFSTFLFLGLALVKRLTELVCLASQTEGTVPRRAYLTADISVVQSFASSALYLSVLVMALYINSPDVVKLYARPEALWPVCLMLIYWVSRVLMLANRGSLSDDPVLFAIKDRISHAVAVLIALCVVLAMPVNP